MGWVTTFSALAAALFSGANLMFTYFDRRDSICVKWGSHKPIATPGAGLYVVNTGKHPVYLTDYGFINADGDLFSIPWYEEIEGFMGEKDPNYYRVGKTTIEPHDFFSIGMSYEPKLIGVYALTSTQDFRRIKMTRSLLWPNVFYKYLKARLWGTYL